MKKLVFGVVTFLCVMLFVFSIGISVYNKENTIKPTVKYNNSLDIVKKININTATKEELTTINGIGEKTAIKIIEYRKTNKFKSIIDIMNINGIKGKTFGKIKNYITVD